MSDPTLNADVSTDSEMREHPESSEAGELQEGHFVLKASDVPPPRNILGEQMHPDIPLSESWVQGYKQHFDPCRLDLGCICLMKGEELNKELTAWVDANIRFFGDHVPLYCHVVHKVCSLYMETLLRKMLPQVRYKEKMLHTSYLFMCTMMADITLTYRQEHRYLDWKQLIERLRNKWIAVKSIAGTTYNTELQYEELVGDLVWNVMRVLLSMCGRILLSQTKHHYARKVGPRNTDLPRPVGEEEQEEAADSKASMEIVFPTELMARLTLGKK